ncbi:sensor histidine kinase [Kribbella sp. NPDC059898]|uniref:sensor histidine kinase n=1 Tax=Kribbella sp. NPDC059898 TaxID=3346995 RepID=UPI00364FDCA6
MGGRRPAIAGMFGVSVLAEIAAIILSWRLEPVYDALLYVLFNLATVGAGAVIAWRRPENAIGWLFLGFGLLNTVASDLAQGWGLRAAAEGWPGGPVGEGISAVSWLPSGYGWTLTFLLFPTGRLPGRRWRAVPWVGAVGLLVSMAAWALSPERGRDFVSGRNPIAVAGLPTGVLLGVGMPLFLGALLAAVLSLAVRFSRSAGLERQQLKWFVLAAVVAGVALPTSFALWYVSPAAGVIAAVALTGLPLAAGAAILRYRLYDVDFVISRTVAYAGLTILLVASYAVVTVALGTFLGSGSGWTVAVATLVCAVLFWSLRSRIQDTVDRRFNRSRYDALHRMTAFLDDVRAGRRPPEDVQTVLREILTDPTLELLVYLPETHHYTPLTTTPHPNHPAPLHPTPDRVGTSRLDHPDPLRAASDRVGTPRLDHPDPLRAAPDRAGTSRLDHPDPLRAAPDRAGTSRLDHPDPLRAAPEQVGAPDPGSAGAGGASVGVGRVGGASVGVGRVGGERGGRQRIAIERGDQPIGVILWDGASPLGPELVRQVLEHGGLAVEIARLRAELNLQLTEVKASRARIVTAAHAERRRIERDLHDGAQQRLVSIGLALRHAQHQLESGPEIAAVQKTLEGAVAEAAVAIGELRELARGLPPAQLDSGLGAACAELARRAPLPVSVRMPDQRFDSGVEAAAYFICCEGLTNAVKHASATRIHLIATHDRDHLLIRVVDDGIGGAAPRNGTGLTGLADRAAALGGTFQIQSRPGAGTTLAADLPCDP